MTQERICDDELILVNDPKVRSAASIILRGANDFYVDEMERSLHDSLQVGYICILNFCEMRNSGMCFIFSI